MAASEESFGEGYPGTHTNQPTPPEVRRAQLSDEMFERENAGGAGFPVSVDRTPGPHHHANLTPEEELAEANTTLQRTREHATSLADTFETAGFPDIAERVAERAEARAAAAEKRVRILARGTFLIDSMS